MAEKKRKVADEARQKTERGDNKRKLPKPNTIKAKGEKSKKMGPRLPLVMRKELERLNHRILESDGEIGSDDALYNGDVYEYEESLPEEETKKNNRFDPVENFEYELPDNFEDENVLSDDEDDDGENVERENSNQPGDEFEEEDVVRHTRMLQGITGLPNEVFDGTKKKNKNFVISEAYPESEYNPSRDVLDGEGKITIQDLLDPLQGKYGYSKLRKRMHQLEKKSISVQAPLPKTDREKLERIATYEQSKKDITKWEPLVKSNREAPTIYFGDNTDLGFSTVGAIASEFRPRTDFEKKIASLVHDEKVLEAHRNDGARLLELNKESVDNVKDRQNRLAKMRSLLFKHEMKAKHIKKIKSKTYHRLLKKERVKAASFDIQMDPEVAREQAMKQEFRRAEERMTLKHKNSSKWAKRIKKRGVNVQDEGTRAAIKEQLHQHALLTRKMNSMKEGSSSSSDEGSDYDDKVDDSSDQGEASQLFEKAMEKTLQVIGEEDEEPNSGVLCLPFMVRGLKKRKDAAYEEAKLALQDYESSLKQLEENSGPSSPKISTSSGRRVFGTATKQVQESSNTKTKLDIDDNNSDSGDEFEARESNDVEFEKSEKVVNVDTVILREESEAAHDPVFKSFDEIAKNPGPKTTYEVAIFASDSWKKMKSGNEVDANVLKSVDVTEPPMHNQVEEEVSGDSDTDSGGEMVDGILSSVSKPSYELPSQSELIRRAFAADDVEEEFEKDKEDILKEEIPEPEKPVLLPGWGQWTHVQQKKGLPSWMVEEHEIAKRKREEALKKRRDAHLKHVIISEKLDKKAEKLHTKTLPYPYTSKEVFEQSIRMPIGPEFNPATAIGALIRPEVVKKQGVIIKPIKFKDVTPQEKVEDRKHTGHTQKSNKSKSNGGRINKKTGARKTGNLGICPLA